LLLVAVLAFEAQLLAAATLQIQFTGLDIEYDGSTISTVGGVDPLNTATFLIDGILAGPTLVAPTDILSADIEIDVVDIPVAGGTGVTPIPAGSFVLSLLTGGLDLILDDVAVDYLPTGFVDFVFSGALASVGSQDLPYGLEIGSEVTVSFSTQIASGSLVDDGTYLSAFSASGTGEISGAVVPEPASTLLLLTGLSLLLPLRRRS